MSKADRVLPREHTDHSKHPLPTAQEMVTQKNIQLLSKDITQEQPSGRDAEYKYQGRRAELPFPFSD